MGIVVNSNRRGAISLSSRGLFGSETECLGPSAVISVKMGIQAYEACSPLNLVQYCCSIGCSEAKSEIFLSDEYRRDVCLLYTSDAADE